MIYSTITTTSGGYSGVTALTLNPGKDVTHTYSGDIGNGAMTLAKTGTGVQGLTTANSHAGLTAITPAVASGSTTGIPSLAVPAPSGYSLQVFGGNELRLVQIGGSPEIAVSQSGDIATGGSQGFGTVTTGTNTSLVFIITNSVASTLNLTGTPLVDVTGANAAEFTVTAVTQSSGNLVLTFGMLNSASRGTAALNPEHSSNLGISDP